MNNKTFNPMKHIVIALILLGSLSSFSQKKWTLKECVDHVIENNISVKQVKNNLLLNDQDIIAAKGQFLPGLGLSFSQNLSLGNVELFEGSFIDRTFHSSNVGLNLSQTVFNGFRNINTYKQSLINRESGELELSRIKDDVSLNVVNAYLNVLFNKENLQTAKTQVEFSRNQIIQVRALVEAGIQPQANIFDAEATFSSDEQRFTVAQNNYDLALLSFCLLYTSDAADE